MKVRFSFHFNFLQRGCILVSFHVDGMACHEMLQANVLHCQ